MRKAVFLDRDGTINIDKDYLYEIDKFEFIPGAIEALHCLQSNGYMLIIITNQSGIARGFYTEADFIKLNGWMINELSMHGIIINHVYYCPHHPDAKVKKYKLDCSCRKPKLGMFEKAIKDYDLDINKCYSIGDKIRDCAICETTDCRGFLISNNEKENIIRKVKAGEYHNVCYAQNLLEAAKKIVSDNMFNE